MIKVSVEVRGVAASLTADVWAESVAQAVDLAKACNPGCEAKLLFPIDPDTFFAKGPAAGTRMYCQRPLKRQDELEGKRRWARERTRSR